MSISATVIRDAIIAEINGDAALHADVKAKLGVVTGQQWKEEVSDSYHAMLSIVRGLVDSGVVGLWGDSSGTAYLELISNSFTDSIEIRRAKAGTTVVASGDVVGNILFKGYDGDQYHTAAKIEAVVDTTPGNNDMPGRLAFYTTTNAASTPIERMRIDNAGFVGIGTAEQSVTAGRKLHVIDDDNPSLRAEAITAGTTGTATVAEFVRTSTGNMADTFGGRIAFCIQDNALVVNNIFRIGVEREGADNTGPLIFYGGADAGTEVMRISSAGLLGIGGAPVASGSSGPGKLSIYAGSASEILAFFRDSNNGAAIEVLSSTTAVMNIRACGADNLVLAANNGTADIYIDVSHQVGLGAAPGAACLLDLQTTTTQAFRLMSLTTTQRNAITPLAGMMIYNNSTGKLNFYSGVSATWQAVTSA